MTKYRNSVFYADKSLGDFIGWAKDREWWKNTIVVLVADHGARVSEISLIMNRQYLRFLCSGCGAVSERGIGINKLAVRWIFRLLY